MDEQMRRLDACIDACAGISTEALESGAIRELVEVAGEVRAWFVIAGEEEYYARRFHNTQEAIINFRDRLQNILAKLEQLK